MADADQKHLTKSDVDTEGSLTDLDGEAENVNDKENNVEVTSRKEALDKLAEGSEYESAEEEREEKASITVTPLEQQEQVIKEEVTLPEEEIKLPQQAKEDAVTENPTENPEESLYELVDEEGGEEGIAEAEDVDGVEFLGEEGHEVDEEHVIVDEEREIVDKEHLIEDEENEIVDEEEEELEDEGSEEDQEEEYVEEERQQGDGEECSPSDDINEKELDFDEDRRNPQYIPKKGMFYEHDDRNGQDEVVQKKEEEPPRDRKKKLWNDEGKWGHDRFREEEQYPKSRKELIDIYGYDIRNEDGPPHARRRRRYGRGPSKYERNWEDQTAYGREKSEHEGFPRGGRRGRSRGGPRFRGRGRGDHTQHGVGDVSSDDVPQHQNEPEPEPTDNAPVINNSDFPALPVKEIQPSPDSTPEAPDTVSIAPPVDHTSVRTLTFENSNYGTRNSVEPDTPPRRGKTPPFSSNFASSRRSSSRGHRGTTRGDYRGRGRANMRHISPRFMDNNRVNQLNTELEHMSIEDREMDNVPEIDNRECEDVNSNHTDLQNMALKGAGDSSGRPKRYSSLRQRSLPESNSYQPPPQTVQQSHAPYYETGYQPALYAPSETCVPTPSTQSQTVTSTPIINPTAYQTFTPPPYTDNFGLRVPVAAAPPRLFPQVSVPAPQPLMAPPPCITPAAGIMSFAAPPPPPQGYQFAYHQQYASPPPPPPAAPPQPDIYQPSITYYYPPSQPPPIRPTVQKRPKAAIPIVPPPERESKRHEKDSSKNRKYSKEPPSDDVSSLRTESSPPQQTSVGVES